ncbi:DMT family transporter [Haloimpatiens sp. FM7315]|uniref:DMT family transporter n=1 Tax=Haloimpatiens sp. FM7315 TaxID=3298609 RepID=UPI0035A3A417
MKNNKNFGYLAVILSNIIIGLSFLFTKTAVSITNPYDTLAMRFTISFGVILLAYLFKIIKLNFKGKNILKLVIISIFFPSGFFLLQSIGLQFINSSEAGIISALSPVLILILSIIFLKENVNFKQIISIIISIFGVIFIFYMKGNVLNFNNIKGIIFIFLSCVCVAIASVLSRKYSKEFTPIEICFFMQLFGFLAFFILEIYKGFGIRSGFNLFSNTSFTIAIVYLAIPCTLLTAILNNYALSKVEASKVGVFANISTIVSIVAGALILKEQIMYYHILGSILIIGGIIGNCYFGNKSK